MAGRKTRTGENWILRYYQEIESGQVLVGRWVRTVYGIVVHGIEEGRWRFDQGKANRALDFIQTFCRHHEGALAPNRIVLETWQKALISVIFGIVDAGGYRQFREVFVVMGRKNGKTLLAAAINAYMLYMDGEYGARLYMCAPKLDQAMLCFNALWQMIATEPEMSELAKKRRSDVYVEESNSSAQPLAFSARKSDGLNPSMVTCDEVASWQGDAGLKQYEVLRSAFGARSQWMLLSISTAGYVNEGIYDELMKRSTRFLLGDSKESHLLPVLYMIDDLDKWNDINELRKSNPNLGVSVSVDYLLEEINIAESSLSKKAEFLTKYCNIKQNSSQAWIDTHTVNLCRGGHLRLEDFRGCYCVGGIDLSQAVDLTACCALIEREGRIHVFGQFFLPAAKIEEATARDGLPYAAYITRGLLTPSGENYVDYQDCYRWFTRLIEEYEIYPVWVGYDRYSAQPLVQQMEAYGFHMDSVNQGENLTGIINTTEGLLKDGIIDIGDNDLMAVHFLDAALKVNAETNRKRLIKMNATAHVDGMAALLDAVCMRQVHFDEIGEQLKNA